MVTTRSRGNKQATGLDTVPDMNTAASAIPTSTDTNTSPLKRKSGADPTDTSSPVTKIAKTGLDPGLDMNTEPAMPPAPAPTPVTPANTTKQQPQQLPTSANVSQPTLDDIIAAAAVGTGFAPNTDTSALATATAPPAPVPAPTVEASLEAMKEPEPEAAPLPELSTVLTEPAVAQQYQPIVPPAPTAPALSTIAAPAPVSANSTTTATAADLGVRPAVPVLAATEEPTVHAGATAHSNINNNLNHSNGVVPLDAFAINSKTNAVPPGDLTPIPSASPLPVVSDQQQNPSPNTKLKGEAALASNIGINTDGNGGGMAPTAPVVAPSGSVVDQQTTKDNHHAEVNGSGDKSTVVNAQPLSSVI
ncbi:hypothetical protein EC991_010316 [Linnemannia zychae]|nr:hypothetical protein EC991_010316 [Linnemannia zychae]